MSALTTLRQMCIDAIAFADELEPEDVLRLVETAIEEESE